MLRKRKVKAPAEEIAAELFQRFVEQSTVSLPEGGLRDSEGTRDAAGKHEAERPLAGTSVMNMQDILRKSE